MADKHSSASLLVREMQTKTPLLGTAEIWDADTPKCWPGRGAAGSPVAAGTAT